METKNIFAGADMIASVLAMAMAASVIALPGCAGFNDSPPKREFVVIHDLSESPNREYQPTAAELHAYVLQELGIKEENAFATIGAKVHLVKVGKDIQPYVETHTLPTSKPRLLVNSKTRIQTIEDYKDELFVAFEALLAAEPNHQRSHIHDGFCYVATLLAESHYTSDRKILAITDAVEVTDNMDFRVYRNNLTGFEAAFDSLSNELNKQCQLMDLTGTEIVFLHNPKSSDGNFMRLVNKFWPRHLKGAIVKFRSNLGVEAIAKTSND